jgi:hypothetical protein
MTNRGGFMTNDVLERKVNKLTKKGAIALIAMVTIFIISLIWG